MNQSVYYLANIFAEKNPLCLKNPQSVTVLSSIWKSSELIFGFSEAYHPQCVPSSRNLFEASRICASHSHTKTVYCAYVLRRLGINVVCVIWTTFVPGEDDAAFLFASGHSVCVGISTELVQVRSMYVRRVEFGRLSCQYKPTSVAAICRQETTVVVYGHQYRALCAFWWLFDTPWVCVCDC